MSTTQPPDLGRREYNPQISDFYSPLATLTERAMRRFGDFAPVTADGELMLMFIDFGNLIVDDVRGHPYWPLGMPLDYYAHSTDTRTIPDAIVENGLLMHYAVQQNSDKANVYLPLYYSKLNGLLWQVINGNRPIQLRVVDNGADPRSRGRFSTSPVNGHLYGRIPR